MGKWWEALIRFKEGNKYGRRKEGKVDIRMSEKS